MPKGKYLIMISPVWNEYAEESPDYKRIFVQLMARECVQIKHLQADDGCAVFVQGLKNYARDLPLSSRQPVPHVPGAFKVITLEAGDLWYGFIYASNPSNRGFEEGLKLNVSGLEVVGRVVQNGELTLQGKP